MARDEADRVFRDAMADTGTSVVRRWLVWTAVATATIFLGSHSWSPARWWGYRLAAAASIGGVLALGSLATLDLFDAGVVDLPWMGDRVWWSELLGGFAGAVAIPFLLGLVWGTFRMAGAIAGILLALLLHVTLVLLGAHCALPGGGAPRQQGADRGVDAGRRRGHALADGLPRLRLALIETKLCAERRGERVGGQIADAPGWLVSPCEPTHRNAYVASETPT